MLFGNFTNSKQKKIADQSQNSDSADSIGNIVKIQSILKLSIGTGLSVLVVMLMAAFFPNSLELIFGLNLLTVHIYLLIGVTAFVVVGSAFAFHVANQGNQKLAFSIAVVFIYGSFYGAILISPIGFHDPGLYFVSALLILASLFVGEKALRFHTVVIIGIFGMAFVLERTGIKQTDWPMPTWHELLTIAAAFFLTQLLLSRTIFVLRQQSEQLNQQKNEILRYQTQLEEMVQSRTSDLIQEKNRAIRANLAKSQFLANMSHELRTPLNAIIGYGELVVDGLNDEVGYQDQLTYAENIEKDVSRIVLAGRNLLDLINHVLDFSKIEANQMTIRIEKVNILRVVNEAVALINPLLGKMGNKIVIRDIDSNLYAYGDAQKLRQVLINLLGNANKFTDSGSIIILAETEVDCVAISVIDTGIGIEPHFISQLFQPFVQADNDFSRQFEGTGLGLAISKRFVELMNGTIDVESVVGQGTSFTVSIPMRSPLSQIRAAGKLEALV